MKNLLTLVLILTISIHGLAQTEKDTDSIQTQLSDKKHELKLNMFNLVMFKTLDVSYEYILDSESSIGTSVLFNLRSNESNEDIYYREKFALTPYYRRYFSKAKHGYGFFVEAFAMYNVQADYNYFFEENGFSDDTSSNFAIGFSVGGKFITKKGFAFDLYGGLGRNFISSDDDVATDVVPRLGVSLGYRF